MESDCRALARIKIQLQSFMPLRSVVLLSSTITSRKRAEATRCFGLDSGGPAVVEPKFENGLCRPETLRRHLSMALPLSESCENCCSQSG
jgi:hypothetical protein